MTKFLLISNVEKRRRMVTVNSNMAIKNANRNVLQQAARVARCLLLLVYVEEVEARIHDFQNPLSTFLPFQHLYSLHLTNNSIKSKSWKHVTKIQVIFACFVVVRKSGFYLQQQMCQSSQIYCGAGIQLWCVDPCCGEPLVSWSSGF